MKPGIRNLARIVALLLAAAFLFGCGVDQSPVASSEGSELTPAAKPPAGKGKNGGDSATSTTTWSTTTSSTTTWSPAERPLYTETVSGTFSPDRSGTLKARFKNYGMWATCG